MCVPEALPGLSLSGLDWETQVSTQAHSSPSSSRGIVTMLDQHCPARHSIPHPPLQLGFATGLISSHGMQTEETYSIFRPGPQMSHDLSSVFLLPTSRSTQDPRLRQAQGVRGWWDGGDVRGKTLGP